MRLVIMNLWLLTLTTYAWTATRCTTYEEKILGRLQTLCDDGTRAVSTYNWTLSRWESSVTTPPGADLPRAGEPAHPAGGGTVSMTLTKPPEMG